MKNMRNKNLTLKAGLLLANLSYAAFVMAAPVAPPAKPVVKVSTSTAQAPDKKTQSIYSILSAQAKNGPAQAVKKEMPAAKPIAGLDDMVSKLADSLAHPMARQVIVSKVTGSNQKVLQKVLVDKLNLKVAPSGQPNVLGYSIKSDSNKGTPGFNSVFTEMLSAFKKNPQVVSTFANFVEMSFSPQEMPKASRKILVLPKVSLGIKRVYAYVDAENKLVAAELFYNSGVRLVYDFGGQASGQNK